MKKYYIYIAFIALALMAIASCEPRKQDPSQLDTSVEIKGQIKNFSSGRKLYIKRQPTVAELFGLPTNITVDSVSIGADGNFTLKTTCEKAGYYSLFADTQIQLYLLPGTNIEVYYDAKAPEETVEFRGELAAENAYIRSRDSFLIAASSKFSDYQTWPLDTFLTKFNTLETSYLAMFKEWKSNNRKSNPFFLVSEDAEIQYQMATLRDLYAAQLLFTKGAVGLAELGPKYFSYHDDMQFDRDAISEHRAYINSLSYSLLIRVMREHLAGKDSLPPFEQLYQKRLQIIPSVVKSDIIRNQIALTTMMEASTTIGEQAFIDLEPVFLAACNDSTYKAGVSEKVQALASVAKQSQPGTQAPPFAYPDINGKEVSLQDLRGKYVYIDVWATWCGPCIKEIPYLKKLEAEFSGKKVAFVSISVDESKREWQTMVKKEGLKGIQLWGGPSASITKDFSIDGIPRFILLDQEGKIISANAARPSGGIREQLLQLPNL